MSGGLLSASSTDSGQDVGQCTMLTESSSEADGRGEGPQNMSAEERKKRRAEVARRAKAAKAAEGARPLPAPFADLAHTAVVHCMLHSATLASREVRAKKWKVKPKWLGAMTEVLAKLFFRCRVELLGRVVVVYHRDCKGAGLGEAIVVRFRANVRRNAAADGDVLLR